MDNNESKIENEIGEICKKICSYDRQVAIMGEKEANSVLYFTIIGYESALNSKTSGVRDIEKLKLEFIEYWQGKTLDELCGKDVWSFFLPHLQSKGEVPTDAEITHYWKRKNCFGQYLEGLEHGSIWMRDKLSHPQLDTTKEAEKDIVCQHDFELLNDTGVQKCKDCGKLK